MALTGNAESNNVLHGKLHGLQTIHGYSAYEVAVINGFSGTEEEWLASLVGPIGPKGDTGNFEALTDEQKEQLRGHPGKQGNGIASVAKTGSMAHSSALGEIDYRSTEYTITFDDGSTFSFWVNDGKKGDTGRAVSLVDITLHETTEEGNVYRLAFNNAGALAYQYITAPRGPAGWVARIGEVKLLASAWTGSGNLYSQVVQIEGVTAKSQVDLTPSVEQLVVFYEKDLTFVTENEDGVVTVYAIGQKPTNDYTVQVTITEVSV